MRPKALGRGLGQSPPSQQLTDCRLLARLVDVVRLLVEVRMAGVGGLQLVRHLGGLRREVRVALGRGAADAQRAGRNVWRIL